MKRRNFLLSLPLIGLAAKAIAKTELNEVGQIRVNNKKRVIKFKRCDDGKFIIHHPDTKEIVKGNFIYVDGVKFDFQ